MALEVAENPGQSYLTAVHPFSPRAFIDTRMYNLYYEKNTDNWRELTFLEKYHSGELYLSMNDIRTKIKSNRANAITTPELQRVYIDGVRIMVVELSHTSYLKRFGQLE